MLIANRLRRVAITTAAGVFLFLNGLGCHKAQEESTAEPQEGAEAGLVEGDGDIMSVLSGVADLSVFAARLRECGLDQRLAGDGPFTVLAPYDSAFAEMERGESRGLIEDSEKLKLSLAHHIIEGEVLLFDEVGTFRVRTMAGEDLEIVADYEEVKIGDAFLLEEGIWCTNGVIHVIDGVLRPTFGPRQGN
jgi:uncharacterized surface protein with fasciclin (FAS1) repeats